MISLENILVDASLARAIFGMLPVDDKFALAWTSRGALAAFDPELRVIVAQCTDAVRAAKIGSDILFRWRFTPEHASDALFAAAKFGRVEAMKFVVARHSADPDSVGHIDFSYALHCAGRSGNVEAINYAFSLGVGTAEDVLRGACRGRHVGLVGAMLGEQNRERTNGIWPDYSVLISACRGGCAEIVRRIIATGVDRNGCAIYEACESGNIEVVDIMTQHIDGADLHVRDVNGQRCALAAVAGGNREVIDRVERIWTLSANAKLAIACGTGRVDLAAAAIAAGASDFYSAVCSCVAARRRGIAVDDVFEAVVDHVCGMNASDVLNLHYVIGSICSIGEISAANKVIACGHCDTQICADFGLRCAARGGHGQIVDLFAAHGASDFEAAFSCACEGRHREIAAKLLSRIRLPCDLRAASKAGYFDFIKSRAPNSVDYGSCLLGACEGNRPSIAKFAVAHGATNLDDALIIASAMGHTRIMRFLLSRGAGTSEAAFWRAKASDQFGAMRVLIEAGYGGMMPERPEPFPAK